MIVIQGETSGDWIAICAASAISWARRIRTMVAETGTLPRWAGVPPARGSVVYRNDQGQDVWTFGGRSGTVDPSESITHDVAHADCDTLMAAGAGVRLYTRKRARIVTVSKGDIGRERGHTFETDSQFNGRGYALWDMSVWGGMRPLAREEYNLTANVAVIESLPNGGFAVALTYGIPPLTIV